MMQKKPFKVLRILAVVAGVLAVLFFILTIVRETMTGVFEPLFVLFLVCVYHCGVRLIMDTSLSDEDAADSRKVRVVHILNIVLGLLSFVLLLFPHNRVLAAVLIAAVTLLFSVNDLVVLRRLGAETAYDYDYANSAFDENDEDILNTDASVKAAREEAERERNALREAPAEELPSGRRRRKPIVLRSSDPEVDEEWSARAADRRTAGDAALARRAARTGEISASDAMAAMAGFGAALNTETPKPVAPEPAAPEPPAPSPSYGGDEVLVTDARCGFILGQPGKVDGYHWGGDDNGYAQIRRGGLSLSKKSKFVAAATGAIGSMIEGKGKDFLSISRAEVLSFRKVESKRLMVYYLSLASGQELKLYFVGDGQTEKNAAMDLFLRG